MNNRIDHQVPDLIATRRALDTIVWGSECTESPPDEVPLLPLPSPLELAALWKIRVRGPAGFAVHT